MKNNNNSVSSIEVKSEKFEALKRAAEKDNNAIYPLAVSIAFSNIKTALDPMRKTATNYDSVSDSGMDDKLYDAKKQLAIAVNQINNIRTESVSSIKGKVVRSFDKKAGKMLVSVSLESKPETISPDELARLNANILDETIDGIGLEIVSEVSLSLLESKEKYGKSEKWLEKDVTIRKPKKTVLASRDEKIEYTEEIVKPIQLAYRAGANFINKQRAVKNRVSDTVYLDMFRDDGESKEPKELTYSLEDCVLKISSTYDNIGQVEEIESLISRLDLTKRESQLLKWLLDGMDCFAYDAESGKKVKIHIDNPSSELLGIRLNVTDRTIRNTKNSLQAKAEKIGLSPERLAKVKTARKIKRIDPCTGKTLSVYDSRTQAARLTGIDKGNILKALSGKWNFAGGYIWKYCENTPVMMEENSARNHF